VALAWQHEPVRVYLPLTHASLARLIATGQVGTGPLLGYAVTPSLREWYAEGDLEELEYVALTHAARASLRLLADEPSGSPRRLVLAADVADGRVHPDADADVAAVRIDGVVDLALVVSAHVDDPDAADDVLAGVRALDAAAAGNDDARFVVDSVDDHELQWFAAQEIASLLEK
jgi:hypothetical protein